MLVLTLLMFSFSSPLTAISFVMISLVMLSAAKFALSFNHALTMLLTLELMTLLTFFVLLMGLALACTTSVFAFTFLTLAVCEASVGLCLLVNIGRNKGSDFLPL